MKYLLFGTGDCYTRYKIWFPKGSVTALLDNSAQKQGTDIDGVRVVSPKEGVRLAFDCVVILSFYVKEMKQQLMELGVSEDRIYHFYDLHRLVSVDNFNWEPYYFGNARAITESNAERKILLLSRDMTFGGPAIALYHAAKILKEHGWQVVFASMIDGPLKEKILLEGISVIVDRKLQIGTMKNVGWSAEFSVIVCNTNNFCIFLSDRNQTIPVIWWLHDSLFFYDGINQKILLDMDKTNLYTVSVGSVPQKAIQTFLPDLPVEQMLYGVEDVCPEKHAHIKRGERTAFVAIGYIEPRKGQDILIQAIEKLPGEVRRKAVFYLVGQNSSLLAQTIRGQIRDIPEVVMTGVLDRAGIDAVLEKADVLICPSREDPMPTVAAEAMMHRVPCLLSDAVGTAEYIRHGIEGMIFPSQDADALSREIEWCILHSDLLAGMGEKARRIYEENFSMDAFKRTLLETVEKVSDNGERYKSNI